MFSESVDWVGFTTVSVDTGCSDDGGALTADVSAMPIPAVDGIPQPAGAPGNPAVLFSKGSFTLSP